MRRIVLIALACAFGSLAVVASAQARSSVGTKSRSQSRVRPALEFPGKPKKEQLCNTEGAVGELLIYTNKATKAKTFKIPPYDDEGIVEKGKHGLEILNEIAENNYYYEGYKQGKTKRFVGGAFAYPSGELLTDAEWGKGLTDEFC